MNEIDGGNLSEYIESLQSQLRDKPMTEKTPPVAILKDSIEREKALQRELATVKEALRQYGRHNVNCSAWKDLFSEADGEPHCDCGFNGTR
jgi:hypothetical protein